MVLMGCMAKDKCEAMKKFETSGDFETAVENFKPVVEEADLNTPT